jgi:hypothetical protein
MITFMTEAVVALCLYFHLDADDGLSIVTALAMAYIYFCCFAGVFVGAGILLGRTLDKKVSYRSNKTYIAESLLIALSSLVTLFFLGQINLWVYWLFAIHVAIRFTVRERTRLR